MQKIQQNILWIDGIAGLSAGGLMLLLSSWLTDIYNLPHDLLVFMGIVNLIYGANSSFLASRVRRRAKFILLLVVANSFWAAVCCTLVFLHYENASIFGLGQLVLEGIFVGTLAYFEWKWRGFLKAGEPYCCLEMLFLHLERTAISIKND